MIEVVTLTGTLTNAGENRETVMLCCYITDKLLYKHRLTNAGASEESNLSTLLIGAEQINDLDTCLQHLLLGTLLFESRRRSVNGRIFHILRCGLVIDRLAQHVEYTAQGLLTYRYAYGCACCDRIHSSYQSVSRTHSHATHCIITQMLRNFYHQCSIVISLDADSFVYLGKIPVKLNVQHCTDDLCQSAFLFCHFRFPFLI